MDGFTALGIAANICQFIEYGFQIVNKVKNVRDDGQLDPDLERDTRHLKDVASKLTPQSLPSHSGAIGAIAADCIKLSDELLNELFKSKPKDSKSKWQSFKAVVRSEYKKRDVAELEAKLGRCRSQLTLQMTDILRLETTARLDKIVDSSHAIQGEVKALHSAMDALRPTVNATYIGEDIAGMLRDFMNQSDKALSRVRRMLILNILRFPNVHERFDDIAEAHEDTFDWLFHKSDEFNNDTKSASSTWTASSAERKSSASTESLPSSIHPISPSQMVASDTFISWLEQGNEFFHISGKPGAGKSTLMRYISLHPDLLKHLQVWSQTCDLAIGSFFFWRHGSVEQKSIKGLLRGLLFSILEGSPALIPVAFPTLWEISLLQPAALPTLEHRDILEAFRNVLASSNSVGSVKFAFFIDGLDEFEGRHTELIQTMRDWMLKYPNSVKCCVSSREYIIFQEAFATCPRIRLHELTENDISTMIHGRLESVGNSLPLSTEDMQGIEELIIERAEGVFLWVSLVIGTVEEGLLSGDDAGELEKKIELCPTELEDLFQHLLASIHPGDRDWAFSVIVWVRYVQSHGKMGPFGFFGKNETRPGNLSILELSALDVSKHALVDSKRNTEPNKDRADNLIRDMHRKVYGRCKGLLEVRGIEESESKSLLAHVTFTHRSIVEFLEAPHASGLMARHTRNFDPFQATCQAFMACIKQIPSGAVRILLRGSMDDNEIPDCHLSTDESFIYRGLRRLLVWSVLDDRSGSGQFLEFLDALECTVMDSLPPGPSDDTSIGPMGLFECIVLTTLSCGVYEYIEWAQDRSRYPTVPPFHGIQVYMYTQAFRSLLRGRVTPLNQFSAARFTHVIGHFAALGNGLNTVWEKSIPPSRNSTWSLWEHTLWDLIMDPNRSRDWDVGMIVDWFLRNGADPALPMCNFRNREVLTVDSWEPEEGWVAFEPSLADGEDFILPFWVATYTRPNPNSEDQRIEKERAFDEPWKNILLVRESSPIFQSAARNSWVLHLREFLSIWMPDDFTHFQQLIDSLSGVDPDTRPEAPLPLTRKVKLDNDVLGEVWGSVYPQGKEYSTGKQKVDLIGTLF